MYCARCQHNKDRHIGRGCEAKTKRREPCKCLGYVAVGKRYATRAQADAYLDKEKEG